MSRYLASCHHISHAFRFRSMYSGMLFTIYEWVVFWEAICRAQTEWDRRMAEMGELLPVSCRARGLAEVSEESASHLRDSGWLAPTWPKPSLAPFLTSLAWPKPLAGPGWPGPWPGPGPWPWPTAKPGPGLAWPWP
jgi:hypothetical protein